eukprot:TRINITY_DN5233_c0_g1_i1.p1 TRINITY_DN5233_c0_g1~~TRINITY_DN5233_c0_g1_i1.p1  ORF type:complete len:324 (-),score=72.02 TRINITY_DN5233_c0_g1_i1:65-1036(-)
MSLLDSLAFLNVFDIEFNLHDDAFDVMKWPEQSVAAVKHIASLNPGTDFWNKEIYMIVGFTLAWTITHILFTMAIRPIARYLVVSPDKVKAKKKKSVASMQQTWAKFETSAWKFCLYTCMWIYGVSLCWRTDWFLVNEKMAINWPEVMSDEMTLYYMITLTQYIHASLVIFWQPKQKDFYEMLIHHIVTITLVLFSYAGGFYQIGATIIIFTDTADPLMEAAKLCLYSGWEKMADFFFTVFAIVFIVTRVILFPFYCMSPAWTAHRGPRYLELTGNYVIPCYHFLNGFIFILYLLFLFWTMLIIRGAIDMYVKGEEKGDPRDE